MQADAKFLLNIVLNNTHRSNVSRALVRYYKKYFGELVFE